MSTSLEKLTNNLKTKCRPYRCAECTSSQRCSQCVEKEDPREVFRHTFQHISSLYGSEHFDMLTRKQVYPYSFVNDWEKLKLKTLPEPEEFFNFLTKEAIKPEEYAHARRVFEELKLPNMRAFCSLYLSLDILLLVDCFEDFRHLSLREDQLEPLFFVTLPGLSLASALKMTGIRLELITDPTLHLWFEVKNFSFRVLLNIFYHSNLSFLSL